MDGKLKSSLEWPYQRNQRRYAWSSSMSCIDVTCVLPLFSYVTYITCMLLFMYTARYKYVPRAYQLRVQYSRKRQRQTSWRRLISLTIYLIQQFTLSDSFSQSRFDKKGPTFFPVYLVPTQRIFIVTYLVM